jgi:hypothetical protein
MAPSTKPRGCSSMIEKEFSCIQQLTAERDSKRFEDVYFRLESAE